MRPRVIPCLLLKNDGLVKTVGFKNPIYLGDPINAVKIFNDKEVDELIFLDITATIEQRKPRIELISKITDECFMPLAYGGGVRNVKDIRKILSLGVEKVSINTYAVENPAFITAAADLFGRQSIIVSIDVKRDLWGKYKVFTHSGRKNTGLDPVGFAIAMEARGAGELFLNSIDQDGRMQGYDIELITRVSKAVNIPVVACGGAGSVAHLAEATQRGGASAVAAGSLFVFQGRHRAVLINYPTQKELRVVFEE